MDEHNTATNGRYELQQSLEQELIIGMFSSNFMTFFPPILQSLEGITVRMVDSRHNTLVRAADIIANRVFYCARQSQIDSLKRNVFLLHLP